MNLVSCGKDSFINPYGTQQTVYKVEPAATEDYSYEFGDQVCSTGKQSFITFKQACDGLKDEQLNNECAGEQRAELFTISSCPGSFS